MHVRWEDRISGALRKPNILPEAVDAEVALCTLLHSGRCRVAPQWAEWAPAVGAVKLSRSGGKTV